MAEVIAFTRVYQLAKDQKVNKYTESTCGVVRDLGMLWKQSVFLTPVGTSPEMDKLGNI